VITNRSIDEINNLSFTSNPKFDKEIGYAGFHSSNRACFVFLPKPAMALNFVLKAYLVSDFL
jgi:hypothetical protein